MTDFFDRLEADLREAALCAPRARVVSPPAVAGVLTAALAVAAAALLLGGGEPRVVQDGAEPRLSPVGTVIPKGSGTPPRSEPSMVVATGETTLGGPWQLEVFSYPRGKGPKSPERRAGKCLVLYLPSAPGTTRPGLGGFCGPGDLGFRKTPGFSRQQTLVPPSRARAVIVFGRTPVQASKVVLTVPNRVRIVVEPQPAPPGFRRRFGFDAGFYAVAVPRRLGRAGARINWLDTSGQAGSRGIRLMPPLVPQRR
jgi:hypothetical protein